MQPGHGFVSQDGHPAAAQKRRDLCPGARQKPRPDPHVIAPRTQRHADAVGLFGHVVSSMSVRAASASTTFSAISSTE